MAKKNQKKVTATPLLPTHPSFVPHLELYGRYVLYFIFAILPFAYPHNTVAKLSGQVDILAVFCGIAVPITAYAVLKGWLRVPRSLFWTLFGLLLASTLFATIFSLVPMRSIWGAYIYGADGLIYFITSLCLVFLFACYHPRQELFLGFLRIIAVQALLVSMLVLWESYKTAQTVTPFRAISPLLNGDYGISYLLLTGPLVATWFWLELKAKRWWAAALLLIGGLSFVLSIFYLSPIDLQVGISKKLGLPTAATHGATYVPDPSQPAIDDNLENFLNNPSNTQRYTQWFIARTVAKDNLLNGSGPGTGRIMFYSHARDLKDWDFKMVSEVPHNEFLQYFSQQGIPGALAYSLFWLGTLLFLVARWKYIEPRFKPYVAGLGGGLLLYIVFNQLVFAVPVTGFFSYVLSFIAIYLSTERKEITITKKSIPFFIAASALLLFIGFWAFRYVIAERYALSGQQQGNNFHIARTKLETAQAWFPYESNYNRLAGGYAFAEAVTKLRATGQHDTYLENQAISSISKAVDENPYIYRNILSKAAFQFMFATDKPTEDQAVDNMITALDMSPWDPYIKIFVHNIIDQKKDNPSYNEWFQRLSNYEDSLSKN